MCFPLLTVRENLETGFAVLPRGQRKVPDEIFDLFPILKTMLRPPRRRPVRRPAAATVHRPRAGHEAAADRAGRTDRGHPAQHHQGYRPGDRPVARRAATWPFCWWSSISISPRNWRRRWSVMDRGDIVLAGPAGGPRRSGCTTAPLCLNQLACCNARSANCALRVKRRGPETVLDDLRQAGCLKARFPRRVVPGWMDVVMLNTGGGVAGGDRLDLAVGVGAGAQATSPPRPRNGSTGRAPADPPSHVRTHLTVGAGAALEWLPQETILFDRCALDRRLEVDLAPDARFSASKPGVRPHRDGRAGGAGVPARPDPHTPRRRTAAARRDPHGRRHRRPAGAHRRRRPGPRSSRRSSTCAPDTDGEIGRPCAHRPLSWCAEGSGNCDAATVEAGASAWNGMLIARILGPDSASVRRAVIAALAVLREDRPLPRVWLC